MEKPYRLIHGSQKIERQYTSHPIFEHIHNLIFYSIIREESSRVAANDHSFFIGSAGAVPWIDIDAEVTTLVWFGIDEPEVTASSLNNQAMIIVVSEPAAENLFMRIKRHDIICEIIGPHEVDTLIGQIHISINGPHCVSIH
jgi:hypothetical protein